MFERLFRRPRQLTSQDFVWNDDEARLAGLLARLPAFASESGALVVTRDARSLERTLSALATLHPTAVDNGFALDDAVSTLARNRGVAVTLADIIQRRTPATTPTAPPAIHVLARSPRRGVDARLSATLQGWHPGPIVFHSSLEDALLREHAASIGPMLESLGLRRDEPLSGTAISHALRKAQRN